MQLQLVTLPELFTEFLLGRCDLVAYVVDASCKELKLWSPAKHVRVTSDQRLDCGLMSKEVVADIVSLENYLLL